MRDNYILIKCRPGPGRFWSVYGPCPAIRVHDVARYTDEHIEHWGEVFVRERLAELGLVFETFIESPADILAAVTSERDRLRETFAPLLPRQEAVRRRLAGGAL